MPEIESQNDAHIRDTFSKHLHMRHNIHVFRFLHYPFYFKNSISAYHYDRMRKQNQWPLFIRLNLYGFPMLGILCTKMRREKK